MTNYNHITITQAKELSLKQTSSKTMSSITKAFIPRILGNITASTVADVFAAKQIGNIKNIDMRHRKSENNELYSFAFLDIVLYDTKEATALCEDILDNGSSKVFYDRTNYWEVKSFIPRNNRPAKPSSKVVEKAETKAIHRRTVAPIFVRDDLSSVDNDENAELEEGEIRDICEELRTPPKNKDQALEKMAMHSELLHAYNFREMESAYCSNCGCKSNPEYMRTVFWKKYSFCSGWCQYDMESNIRSNWLKSQSHAAQFICPASVAKQDSLELSAPAVRLEMNDQSIAESSSKFIAMFQRIQEEADQEMQYIRNVCGELMKRPTAFTAEDRTELEKDYENLEKEIMNA